MSGRGDYLHVVASRREPLLAGAGSGPHDPDVNARLARLEDEFRMMRSDLSATRATCEYIRGRLESLPTTWQMVSTVLAGNVGLAGVLFAAVKLFAPH
jgi:hypothetical protein